MAISVSIDNLLITSPPFSLQLGFMQIVVIFFPTRFVGDLVAGSNVDSCQTEKKFL